MTEIKPQSDTAAKSKVGIPFILVMIGFLLMPVATYFYLRPAPEVGGFNALDAIRAEERLQIRQEVAKQAMFDLGEEVGAEYAWVDKAVGTVRIPISEAMSKTVDLLAAKSVRQADFVDAVTAAALGITPDPSVMLSPESAAPISSSPTQESTPTPDTINPVNQDESAINSSEIFQQ